MVEVIFALYLVFISAGIAGVVFAGNQNLPHPGPGLGGQSELWIILRAKATEVLMSQ